MRAVNLLLVPMLVGEVACTTPPRVQATDAGPDLPDAGVVLDAGSAGTQPGGPRHAVGGEHVPGVDGGVAPRGGAKRHSIPRGLVGVAFSERTVRPPQDLSLPEAVTIKERLDEARRRAPADDGHEAWFFDAFDSGHLFFYVARHQKNPVAGRRPWATYDITQRYRVQRSREAESALGVDRTIAEYEVGTDGIRAGMTQQEVEQIAGSPGRVEQLGPFGSFDYVYPRWTVRFLESKVASVQRTSPPPSAAPPSPERP
jgi:hypothetical protein